MPRVDVGDIPGGGGRRIWADSTHTGIASGTTGIRAIAAIAARTTLHHPKAKFPPTNFDAYGSHAVSRRMSVAGLSSRTPNRVPQEPSSFQVNR
jgi:hypothetical protein